VGDAIFHVHAKDTRVVSRRLALASRIETTPNDRPQDRSWNYVTLGHGHNEAFWADVCRALRRVGYDDVLSIEHEDTSMTPEAGVRESVELLRRTLTGDPVNA
jgi:sugar phosphate isomerase/epimerase